MTTEDKYEELLAQTRERMFAAENRERDLHCQVGDLTAKLGKAERRVEVLLDVLTGDRP
jgi:hypothetical protein